MAESPRAVRDFLYACLRNDSWLSSPKSMMLLFGWRPEVVQADVERLSQSKDSRSAQNELHMWPKGPTKLQLIRDVHTVWDQESQARLVEIQLRREARVQILDGHSIRWRSESARIFPGDHGRCLRTNSSGDGSMKGNRPCDKFIIVQSALDRQQNCSGPGQVRIRFRRHGVVGVDHPTARDRGFLQVLARLVPIFCSAW